MKNQYGLEPCPFCGSSVVSINVDGAYRWVECGNSDCLASAKAFLFIHDAGNADYIVANNWNTRPIEDALRAQLAEARAFAEKRGHAEDCAKFYSRSDVWNGRIKRYERRGVPCTCGYEKVMGGK